MSDKSDKITESVNFREIYRSRADDYERLVSREDYRGHIQPALARIRPLEGLEVVELGAGTGRLTRLLLPIVRRILALDNSAHMLAIANSKLRDAGRGNGAATVADNRHLPLVSKSADLVLAGWTLGHFIGWHGQRWRQEISGAVGEMIRVARPDGVVIILETLGTGRENPKPPTSGLGAYYAALETEMGFSSTWIRTDYRFQSLEEGRRLVHFFFGPKMAADFTARQSLSFPECTGIWWRIAG